MDLLFHQITIFILMMIYVPLIMSHIMYMIKENRWSSRLCYGVISIGLIVNFPNIIENYQQYLMGHFCGLPEVTTIRHFTADVIFVIIFALVISICICTSTACRR